MIDPRALQQHFKSVQQRQLPIETVVPRVPDLKPLTALEPIPEPETIPLPEPNNTETIMEELPKQNFKVEETVEETKTDNYDPYGYYFNS